MILQKHSVVKAASLVFFFWFLVAVGVSGFLGWFHITIFSVRLIVLLVCIALGCLYSYTTIFYKRRENEKKLNNKPLRGVTASIGETFNFMPDLKKLGDRVSDAQLKKFEAPEISALRKEISLNEQAEFLDDWRKNTLAKGEEYKPYVDLFDEMLRVLAHPEHIQIPASPVVVGGRNHGNRSVITHSLLVSQLMLFRSKEFADMYEPDISSYKLLKNPDYRFNPNDPLIPLIGLAHDLGKLESWEYDEQGNVVGVKYRHAQRSAMVLTRLDSFWHPALSYSVLDIVKDGESKNPNENDRNYLSMIASCHHDIAALPHLSDKNKDFWLGKLTAKQKAVADMPAIISDRLHALMQLLYLCDKEASWIENQSNTQPMKVNHKFVGLMKQEWRNAQRALDNEITNGYLVAKTPERMEREFWQILYSAITSEYFIKKDSESMSHSPLTYSEVLDSNGKYIKDENGINKRYLFISMAALIEYITDKKVYSASKLQNEYADEFNAILNGFFDFKYPDEIGREESAGNILLNIARIAGIHRSDVIEPSKDKLGAYVVSIGLYAKSAIANKDGGFKTFSEVKGENDKAHCRSSTHMVCIDLELLKQKGIPIHDLSKIHKSDLVVFVTGYSFGATAATQTTKSMSEEDKDNLIGNAILRSAEQKKSVKHNSKQNHSEKEKADPKDVVEEKKDLDKPIAPDSNLVNGCVLNVARRNLRKIEDLAMTKKSENGIFSDDTGRIFGYSFKASLNNDRLIVASESPEFFLNVFGIKVNLKVQEDKTTHMELLSSEREKALSVCAANFSTNGRINIGFLIKE